MENSSRKELLAAYYAATPEDQSKYRYQYSLVEIRRILLFIGPAPWGCFKFFGDSRGAGR